MRSRFLAFGLCICLAMATGLIAQDNPANGNSGQQAPPTSAPPTSAPPTSAPPTALSGSGGFNPSSSTFNPGQQNQGRQNQGANQRQSPNPNDAAQSFTPLSELMNKAANAPTENPQTNQNSRLQGSKAQPYRMQSGGTLEPSQASDPPNFPNNPTGATSNNQTGIRAQPNRASFYQEDNLNSKASPTNPAATPSFGAGAIRPVNHTEPGQQQDQIPNSQFNSGSGFNTGGATNGNIGNPNFGGQPTQSDMQNQRGLGGQNGIGQSGQNALRSAALPYNNQGVSNNNQQMAASASTGNLKQLVSEFDVLSVQGQLPGVPKTLIEVIASTPSHMHTQASVAYWDLFKAWARYRRANDWASRLHSINEPQVVAERTLINAARSASLNEVKQRENELRTAQRKLAPLLPGLQTNSQVLPADLPLVGTYETRYEHFSTVRQFDSRYARIHQQLPEIRSLMNNQANTVMQFNQAYAQVMQGYSNRQMPLSSVLETIRLAREQDNKLIDSITQYNQSIAYYAFYVAPGSQSPENIVKMLIKISPESMEVARQAGLILRDTNVRQASLNEGIMQNPNRGSQGNSFAPPNGSQNYR